MNGTQRLPITHAGSLPRPSNLLELHAAGKPGPQLSAALQSAVTDVIRDQRDIGIDIVSDGEFGKPTESTTAGYGHGTWLKYTRARLSGCDWVEPADRTPHQTHSRSRDRELFPEFYGATREAISGSAAGNEPTRTWACTGPIKYVGHKAVHRDISTLSAALGDHPAESAFISVASPASVALLIPNEYYTSDEEYLAALGLAMREEIEPIVNAGLAVQIDDPVIVGNWDTWAGDLEGYRRYAAQHVELLNTALAGIPAEKLRYHVCWGSWQGPHSTDLPLRDVVDLLLKVNASGLCLECGNAQHEHEWRVWEDLRLPDGKTLIPGVVSHKTAVLEHPQTVADRLLRYARCVGRENVIAGTDCGLGGRLSSDLAWAKLRALSEGAALASNFLWPT